MSVAPGAGARQVSPVLSPGEGGPSRGVPARGPGSEPWRGVGLGAPRLMWLTLGLGVGLAGCVEINGGAVESGWTLRDNAGNLIDCAQAQLAFFQFALEPHEGEVDPCDGNDSCMFSCDKGRGITDFIIPEGPYAISLKAMGENRVPLGAQEGVIAPAPVERYVHTGVITDLSVNLIIVNR